MNNSFSLSMGNMDCVKGGVKKRYLGTKVIEMIFFFLNQKELPGLEAYHNFTRHENCSFSHILLKFIRNTFQKSWCVSPKYH